MEVSSELVIPEKDARDMVRLLAEVASAEGGHEEKKRILMDGLCKLVSADYWIWGLVSDYDPDKSPIHTSIITGGFKEEQVPKLILALDNRELEDAMRPLGRELKEKGVQVTRLREEYDSDDVFRHERVHRLWKEADIGAPLVCYRPVANNCLSGIGIYRRFDRPDFSRREARIAHIILTEVSWLHEQGWPWESALQVPQLPHRCQMALNLLLEGLSRKQIADQMDISIHTANEYVKHIYGFYEVHSHAELLNRFRKGNSERP
ncbi:MAG: hypothetical protein KDN20_01240 [Verrucomicrobiae bacterium]|nr:hypothetical protein [Verrucomicrobiae bacterium]